MLSTLSLSSISSVSSNNSSIYGSQTIIEPKDLPSAAPRCRSSLIAFHEHQQQFVSTTLSTSSSPPPPPPPRRRRPQFSSANKSMSKCRHLFRTCLSSTSPTLSLPTQLKTNDSDIRKQYFVRLCHHYRLLLVLNDYECRCGCRFTMKQGSFVVLYEPRNDSSARCRPELVTVISNELICSKVPSTYVCDVALLRERVRSRYISSDDEQSFDL